MIFGDPVSGTIHTSAWGRPAGNLDFKVTQVFGPTSLTAEPALSWPGGEGIAAAYYAHFHRGIDLGNAHCGADVFAAADGEVKVSSLAAGIVIAHGSGWMTGYGHLATRLVAFGATVTKGQRIGTVGNTGGAIGCHLHFGCKSEADSTGNYFSNLNGHWRDPWPRLEQNVTVSIRGSGINVRDDITKIGVVYAITKADGLIHRLVDNADLGPFSAAHAWNGTVTGVSYTIGGVSGDTWETIYVDGAWRYVASPLAMLSAT